MKAALARYPSIGNKTGAGRRYCGRCENLFLPDGRHLTDMSLPLKAKTPEMAPDYTNVNAVDDMEHLNRIAATPRRQ